MAQPVKLLFVLSLPFLGLPAFSGELFAPYTSGASVDEVVKQIKADPLLRYQENQITMAVPVVRESEIFFEIDDKVRAMAVQGNGGYLQRVFFHFTNEKLSSMTVVFSPNFTSYYEVFLKLRDKYGSASELKGPQLVEWEAGGSIIRLERPITVKYVDLATMEELKKQNEENKANELNVKEAILDRM